MSIKTGKKRNDPWADDDEDRKMRKLFVDKLNSSITEQHIIDVFSEFGEIEEVAKYQDRRAPSRYFAFVVYKHARDCEKATRNPCPVIRNKKCECMLAAIGKQFSGYKFFVKKGLLTEDQATPIPVSGGKGKNKRNRKPRKSKNHRTDNGLNNHNHNNAKEQHHLQMHPHNQHQHPQYQHHHSLQQMQHVQDVPGLAVQAMDTSLDSQRSAVTAYSGHGLDDAGNHQPPFTNTPSAYNSYQSARSQMTQISAIQHQPAFGRSLSNPHHRRFNHGRQQPQFNTNTNTPRFANGGGAHSYNMSPRSPYAQQQSAHSRNGYYPAQGQAQPYANGHGHAAPFHHQQQQMRYPVATNCLSPRSRGGLCLDQSRPSLEDIASPASYRLSDTPSLNGNLSNASYYSARGGLPMRAPPSSCPQHQPQPPPHYQHQHRNFARLQHYHPHQNSLPQISSSHSLYPPVPGCLPGSVSPQPPAEPVTVPLARSVSFCHAADRNLSDSGSDSSSSHPALSMMPRSAHCTVGVAKKTRTRTDVEAVDTSTPMFQRAVSTGMLGLGLPEERCITAPDLLDEDLPDVSDGEWTPPPSITPPTLKLNLQDSSAHSKPLPAPLTLQQAQKASDEALADHMNDAGFKMISDNSLYSDDDLDEEEDEEDEVEEVVDNSDDVDHNDMKVLDLSCCSDDVQDIE